LPRVACLGGATWRPAGDRAAAVKRQKSGAVAGSGVILGISRQRTIKSIPDKAPDNRDPNRYDEREWRPAAWLMACRRNPRRR